MRKKHINEQEGKQNGNYNYKEFNERRFTTVRC